MGKEPPKVKPTLRKLSGYMILLLVVSTGTSKTGEAKTVPTPLLTPEAIRCVFLRRTGQVKPLHSHKYLHITVIY